MTKAEEAARLRPALRDFLRRRATHDSDLCAAESIVAELIANVVRHGRGAAEFKLDWRDQHPVLCVFDHGPGFAGPPVSTLSDPTAESGRGLAIVRAFSLDVQLGNQPEGGAYVRVTLPVTRNR